MLATLVIWLSVAVVGLKLVDILLSQAWKTRLSNAAIKTWNVLDEAKEWSFADWLRKPRAIWWLAISLTLLMICFHLWLERARVKSAPDYTPLGQLQTFLVTAFLGITILLMARLIFAHLLRFNSMTQLSGRLLILLICVGISFGLLGFTINKLLDEQLKVAVILMLVIAPVTVALLCLLAIFLSIALAYLAKRILVCRRVRGPSYCRVPEGSGTRTKCLVGGSCRVDKGFWLRIHPALATPTLEGHRIASDKSMRRSADSRTTSFTEGNYPDEAVTGNREQP